MKKSPNNKPLAIFLIIFSLFVYKNAIWDPYFYPERYQNAAEHTEISENAGTGSKFGSETGSNILATERRASNAGKENERVPDQSQIERAGFISVTTETMQTKISLLGGRIVQARLLNFKESTDSESANLDIVSHHQGLPYPLGVYFSKTSDSNLVYEIVDSPTPARTLIVNDAPQTLKLRAIAADGASIEKVFTFQPLGYMIEIKINTHSPKNQNSPIEVEWTHYSKEDEVSFTDSYGGRGFVWYDGDGADRKSFSESAGGRYQHQGVHWISLSEKYFSTVLVTSEQSTVTTAGDDTKNMYSARIISETSSTHFSLFLGPKDHDILSSYNIELQRIIDYGMLGVLAVPLLWCLHSLFSIFGNYGVAIVALTLAIKILLYPLTSSSFKHMKKMQDLAPELKRLRETDSDPTKQKLQMMELYKRHNTNPAGGCFPMLLQMPVFVGLYAGLLSDIALRHAPFTLWIRDLSYRESINLGPIGLPVLVILTVATMLVQQWITPSTAEPMQKKVMMIIPFVMGAIFINFPAGLMLYILTNTLISVFQMHGLHQGWSGVDAQRKTFMAAGAILVTAIVLAAIG